MDDVRFSDFVLDRRTRQLRCGSQLLPIGARAFDLLDFLIARRDRVVSRDEIMASVWADTIVGENNLNVQVASLRRQLGSDAIVTVPRRGLRFTLDVSPDPAAPALPDQPSVVVLPFSTFGGDPGLDPGLDRNLHPDLAWLADGINEDITTELSRFHDLFVVAQNSAFVHRQLPRDLPEIGRALGVRYVVEGSVRMACERVRVTVQLIDAKNGGHVWAEAFERDKGAHFDVQAIVARAIVACLVPQIDRAEADRIRVLAPDDLTARGLAQQGWTTVSSQEMRYDSGPRERAAALARQALERDPRSGLALRVLAWVAWWNVYHGTTVSVPVTLTEGIDAATRAVEIDPMDHHARRLRAQLHLMRLDVETGLPELRHAHDLNPNCALTLCWLGFYEAINGDPAGGADMVEAGLRRSPCDPARGSMLCALGFARFAGHDYAATAMAAEAARAEDASGATPLILGTIAQVGLGRIDAATVTFREAERRAPRLVAARLAGHWLSADEDYRGRARTFFRVAAGQAPVEAADALRRGPAVL